MHNINFLFTQTARKDPDTLTILDGAITLFKRPNSHQWQCRFKLDLGPWHQVSTGSSQLAEATTRAIAIYESLRAKVTSGLVIKNKNFKRLALEQLDILAGQVAGTKGLHTYKDFKFVAERYLIPFFGRYQISEITQKLIDEFESWRESEMGCDPKASTRRHHISAYNKIIHLAQDQGLINQHKSVPRLEAKGDKGHVRPGFTQQEIDYLLDFMREWENDTVSKRNGYTRKLCRYYVEFLLYTGIREGTESWPLRWKNIQWHVIDQEKYIKVWVSGKTGPRYLIAKHETVKTLERLMKWQELPFTSLNELLESKLDRLLFTCPDQTRPHRMKPIFTRLMENSSLLKDTAGKTRTLYSLRHTYATFALADGVDIHTLARQMGTSVLMLEKHYSKLTPMLSAEKLA
jgi:integrase